MQSIGYLLIAGEKIKVLWRSNLKDCVSIKLRTTGKDGTLLSDESEYLAKNPAALNRLKKGFVLKL